VAKLNFLGLVWEDGVGAGFAAGIVRGSVLGAVLSHASKGKLPRLVRILLPDCRLNSIEAKLIDGSSWVPLWEY